MQKHTSKVLMGFALLILVGAGCVKSDASKSPSAPAAKPAATAPAPAIAGTTAFDVGVLDSLNASKGMYVLAPSKKAVTDGKTGTYIFYAAKLLNSGKGESLIETLSGTQETIPNSLILRVGFEGASAKPGEYVLTWWQSGSGMQRAIVTGGTPTEPEVQYLDLDYSASAKAEKLKPGTFSRLVESFGGSTLACKESKEWVHYQKVNQIGDKVLVVGWAGKVKVFPLADCDNVVFSAGDPSAVGDKVQVPVIGSYMPATVTKVDAKIGRVWAKYSFAGAEKEEAFGVTDVIKKDQASRLK